jgi:Protein of unknown function (DUF2894)
VSEVECAVRRAVIDALERRAAAHGGDTQRWLQQRVAQLRAQALPTTTPAPAGAAPEGALAALREAVDRLGRSAAPRSAAAPPATLKAVSAHRHTWSRLRAEQRLRQALAQVPAQAGPLNSSQLVHRALQALHGLSPAYLDAFMTQVDTLLWLEQASGAGDLVPRARRRP